MVGRRNVDDLFYDNFVLTEEVTVQAHRHGMLSFRMPSVCPQCSTEKARRHRKSPLVETGDPCVAIVWYALRIQLWHPVNFRWRQPLDGRQQSLS